MRSKSILIVTMVLFGTVFLEEQVFGTFAICTAERDQWHPAISGTTVVWMDYRGGGWGIYGADLSQGNEFLVSHGIANPHACRPAIDGDIVVWDEQKSGRPPDPAQGIYGKNLSAGQTFSVATGSNPQIYPAISGNFVAWWEQEENGNYSVYGLDLTQGIKIPICIDTGNDSIYYSDELGISGDIIVWTDYRSGEEDIYGYDLSTGTEFPICTASGIQYYPAISGNIVVWGDNRDGTWDVYGYDLFTHEEFVISSEGYAPDVSGDNVVFQSSNGMTYHNLITDDEFVFNDSSGMWLSIDGEVAVWEEYHSDTHGDIYGAVIPEPSTLLLLGLGVPMLSGLRKKCRA